MLGQAAAQQERRISLSGQVELGRLLDISAEQLDIAQRQTRRAEQRHLRRRVPSATRRANCQRYA